MAERGPIPPFPAALPAPDGEALERGLRALRREFDAQEDVAEKASLSHELARIHETRGDLAAAARDELQATNLAGGFVEPLESLISIALRNRSRSNVEKLLSRLLKISRGQEQIERAGIELACHRIEAEDWDGARQIVHTCLEEHAESELMWLAAEVLAGTRADPQGRLSAVLGRADHSQDHELRALLFERAARLQNKAGEADAALASLTQCLDERPTLQRLRMAERLAREAGDGERARDAARQIAALVEAARMDATEFDTTAVPLAERAEGRAQAARFRVAMMQLWAAEEEAAREQWLDLADTIPGELSVLSSLFVSSRKLRDESLLDVLDRAIDATEEDTTAQSFLLTTKSLQQREAGETEAARETIEVAARRAPKSAVVRGLQSDLVAPDLKELGQHLGRLAALADEDETSGPGEEERARLRLAAAVIHLVNHDFEGARTALEPSAPEGAERDLQQAFLHGLACAAAPNQPPASKARVFLWATAHQYFLNENQQQLLDALAELPEHEFPARLARALWPRLIAAPSPEQATTVLDVLSEHEDYSAAASLLSVLVSSDESARSRLLALWHQDKQSPLLVGALITHLEQADSTELPELARNASRQLSDPILQNSLRARAILLLLKDGRTLEALQLLEEAAQDVDWESEPELASAMIWLRRAVRPVSDPSSWHAPLGDPLVQLEDAARMLTERDRGVLSYLDEPQSPPAALLKLLVALSTGPQELDAALGESTALGDHTRGALLFASGAQSGREGDTLLGARRWVELSGNLESKLAWATAARMAEDVDEELRALRAVSDELGAPELLARTTGRGDGEDDERMDSLMAKSNDAVDQATVAWELLENAKEAEPDRRAYLLAHLAACLGNDPDAAAARLQSAYVTLRTERWEEACDEFAALIEVIPDDPALWLGLGVAAFRAHDAALEARAMTELARRSEDHVRAAAYWERAGDLYETELEDAQSAEGAFTAALGRVPGSPHAFERLYVLARSQGDRARLIELIDARLDGAPETDLQVELLWQKARLCRSVGRRAAALKALEALLDRDASNLKALALTAELHLVDRRTDQAAEILQEIALHPETPEQQRSEAGLYACDLLEQQHRPREALTLLRQLEEHGVNRTAVVERSARVAARAGQWDTAYEGFKELSDHDDIDTRLEASSMMLAIQRDHLRDPIELEEAARQVLRDAPQDLDAVDAIVESNVSGDERERLLRPARASARAKLAEHPLDPPGITRYATLCEGAAPAMEERIALGVLDLTGKLSERRALVLEQLVAQTRLEPLVSLSPEDLESIASPGQLGAMRRFAQLVSSAVAELTEPSLAALGLASSMRVDPFAPPPVHETISQWMSLVGLSEFELYIGGEDPQGLQLLQAELPTFVLGENVGPELTKEQRARICALSFSHVMGTAPLMALSADDATNWLIAAARLGKASVNPENPSRVEELARALTKVLSHEHREKLQTLVADLSRAHNDVHHLSTAARAGALKMACLVHGDPSIARAVPEFLPEGEAERNAALSELVRFALSEKMKELRNKLGLEAV